LKKKYVFLGDINSINIELVIKSHSYLKNKTKYILFGNKKDLSIYMKRFSSELNINEIYDPVCFDNYNRNYLNIFNIEDISFDKSKNIFNQIEIANKLSNLSNIDLVTLPVNKSILKKTENFTGITEYLGKINKRKTIMLMHGEIFSIIPLTTHINLKSVSKYMKKTYIKKSIEEILFQINRSLYNFNFDRIKFLCYNPHCSESDTLGNEDRTIHKIISPLKKIFGPYSADSAFKNIKLNELFISMYHDQALIPFKILNKKGINLTLGLNFRRLSPAHGTAKDIKFKNKADISSYLACMEL